MSLQNFDPAIARLIDRERNRQETHLELIASENYVSEEVLQACLLYTSDAADE